MFLALIVMFAGLGISIWGISTDHNLTIWLGISAIAVCCVSWWCWVMFVIKTMIECTDKTTRGLGEIKYDLREIRGIVKVLDSAEER